MKNIESTASKDRVWNYIHKNHIFHVGSGTTPINAIIKKNRVYSPR
jgi:hypothetical protein